jgi:hypothetical protein
MLIVFIPIMAACGNAAAPDNTRPADPPAAASATPVTAEEAQAIVQEAYVFLYPLITMDVTRRQTTNIEAGKLPGRGPMNAFSHIRAYPTADFREVVRPNFDTLYSSAWLDLTEGPVIISVPDTAGRYYLLPMIDMWSDVFAVPGKRTSGTGAANYAVVPPGWTGTLPADVQRIAAPTSYVWIIGRTRTNGAADYEAVHKVQDGYRVTLLADWGKPPRQPSVKIDATVDMKTPPLVQVNSMPAMAYFSYGAELMKRQAPHATDWSIVTRMKRIGIEPGKSFDATTLNPVVKGALDGGAAAGLKIMQDKFSTVANVVNGWQMNTDSIGVYGNYYLKRAIVALVGLGANQPEDAIYPVALTDATGAPLKGGQKYVLHFEKSELPPVEAFWSVTMYDAAGFQVANALNRFAIGDRDALKYNEDGSLDLYVQAENPGPEKESNWLPAPKSGDLGITMRLYAPKPPALDGRWNPPTIKRG